MYALEPEQVLVDRNPAEAPGPRPHAASAWKLRRQGQKVHPLDPCSWLARVAPDAEALGPLPLQRPEGASPDEHDARPDRHDVRGIEAGGRLPWLRPDGHLRNQTQ